jgi:hypothetical protein
MPGINLALLPIGIALIVIGYARFRGPWARYQALKAQDANIARYESWRGGLRDSGPTGASIAMEMLRNQARSGGVVIAVGAVLVLVGLVVR